MAAGPGASSGYVLCVGLPLAQVAQLATMLRDQSVVMAAADSPGALALLQSASADPPPPNRPPIASLQPPSAAGVQPGGNDVMQIGELRVDVAGREVHVGDRPLHLTAREFDILVTMASQVGRVWSYQELTTRVWRTTYLGDPDPVVSAVKRLRKRLALVPSVAIVAVRGIGYRLQLSRVQHLPDPGACVPGAEPWDELSPAWADTPALARHALALGGPAGG